MRQGLQHIRGEVHVLRADFHIHSVFSDGSDTIDELIGMAKEKGLDAIAITDHDTVAHLPEIPKDAGVKVLGGVEISAIHRKTGIKAHILGYCIRTPQVIAALTEPLLHARNANSERLAEILAGNGYRIPFDKLARADGKHLYKQHIMEWLVSTGQAPDMFGDFYRRTFKGDGICAIDIEYIDVEDAVAAVKEAGGLAVLAHPGEQQNFFLIPRLAGSGLDGVELNHHSCCPKDREVILDHAKRHGLFLTGGSDHHGRYAQHPHIIGDFLSEESGFLRLCASAN